jgi:polysaccharide pyruvyl transferase WcaK-like protein
MERGDGKAVRVGLFGLLGSGNLGNNASMESVVRYLRAEHPDVLIDAMCTGPETVAGRYGVPATTMTWYHEKRVARLPVVAEKLLGKGIDVFRTALWVRRHDVVIVPGMGTLESSLPLRSWQVPYSFFLVCASGRLFGTKVAFVSAGAGIVKRRATRFLLDASARLAFYRSYRDEPSRDMMRARGIDVSRDHVFSDLAFGLPAIQAEPGDTQLVGVGLMNYRGSNDDRGQADKIRESYMETMKSFLTWLIEGGYSVRILMGDENDAADGVGEEMNAYIRERHPGLDPERFTTENASSFEELMEAMAPVGTVVAARFHTVICALRLAKPVVSLGYAPKFSALLAPMGLADFCHTARFPDAQILIEQFTQLQQRRAELRQSIIEGNAAYGCNVARQFSEVSSVLLEQPERDRLALGLGTAGP